MEKRYNSFVDYFKSKFGHRIQKIVVDAGFTCPNRDGSVAVGGCTYCDNDAFHPAYSKPTKSISQQLDEGIEFHLNRYRRAEAYLAYFQPYSNTYAPLSSLKKMYEEALSHHMVKGLVIGTRPDCIDEEKLAYLKELSSKAIIIVEYGVESCIDKTLQRINRGHDVETAKKAIKLTADFGILQGAHFIFGLPGESKEQMLSYANFINQLPINTLKFHQLQIIKGTEMEREFKEKPQDFVQFELDEYIDFFIDFLELLRPDLYIERFAGEVPPRFVEHLPWSKIRYSELVKLLRIRLEQRDTKQGARYHSSLFQP